MKIKARYHQFQLDQLDRRCEQDLIRAFKSFTTQVETQLAEIDTSAQLNNILRVGAAYRQVCENIGQDPDHFGTYFRFINYVRDQDRRMEATMGAYRRKYEAQNPEKFRVENELSLAQFESAVQSLVSIAEDGQAQIHELQLQQQKSQSNRRSGQVAAGSLKERVRGGLELIQSRAGELFSLPDPNAEADDQSFFQEKLAQAYYLRHPEKKPEIIAQIDAFRESLTPEQLEEFQPPLTVSEEASILRAFTKSLFEVLLDYEARGDYNHILSFSKLILAKYESLAEDIDQNRLFSCTTEEQLTLKNHLRAAYREVEEWLERAEIKYADGSARNPDEPKIKQTHLESPIKCYEEDRADLMREKENRAIWEHLDQIEQAKAKEEKAKAREKKAKQAAARKKEREAAREARKKERIETRILRQAEKAAARQRKQDEKSQSSPEQKEQESEEQSPTPDSHDEKGELGES